MGWRSQNNDSLNRPRWLNSTGLAIQSAAALATMRPSGLLLRERVFAITGLGSNNSEECCAIDRNAKEYPRIALLQRDQGRCG